MSVVNNDECSYNTYKACELEEIEGYICFPSLSASSWFRYCRTTQINACSSFFIVMSEKAVSHLFCVEYKRVNVTLQRAGSDGSCITK